MWFRIRNKDGKYSNGGSSPKFTRNGKIWDKGSLLRHLKQFKPFSRYGKELGVIYDGCYLEIIKDTDETMQISEVFCKEDLLNYFVN